jgi:hypothetical protein
MYVFQCLLSAIYFPKHRSEEVEAVKCLKLIYLLFEHKLHQWEIFPNNGYKLIAKPNNY